MFNRIFIMVLFSCMYTSITFSMTSVLNYFTQQATSPQPQAPPQRQSSTTPVFYNNNQPYTENHFHINVYTESTQQSNNQASNQATNQAHNEAHNTTSVRQEMRQHFSDGYARAKQMGAALSSRLHPCWVHLTTRWPWYAVGVPYGSLCIFLIQGNRFLNRSDIWGNWKKHMDLSELQMIPQKELAQSLLLSIQNRYMNPTNPTDSITPLTQFIQAIEYEKRAVRRYLYVAQILCTLPVIGYLFPYTNAKVKQAKRVLKRLNFVNHIFISWASDHNVMQVTQTSSGLINSVRKWCSPHRKY